jgi:exonuclease V gamma subunit
MMEKALSPFVLVSNSLERLYACLKERCSLHVPFRKTYIIVSDVHMKTALQIELTKASGIMFSQKIVTVDELSGSSFLDFFARALQSGISIQAAKAKAIEAWNTQELKGLEADEVHVFGVTDLKDLFFGCSNISYYILSPCMHFWSDICSDQEAKSLTKKMREKPKKALQAYLYDRSRLLANNAAKTKEFMAYLEQNLEDFQEEYVIKKWVTEDAHYSQFVRHDVVVAQLTGQATSLDLIQNDMLLLAKQQRRSHDDTFEVHKAPTLMREVEVLYQYIQKILPNVRDRVIVYAPDIEVYKPYIQSLFQHSYQIIGTRENRLETLFTELLDAKQVYTLFQSPAFQRKCGIEESALALLAHCLDRFTKEQLLLAWLTSGFNEIELTSQDAEALGKCLATITQLQKDRTTLTECEKRHNRDWQKLFLQIVDSYFEPTTHEERQEFYAIKDAFRRAYTQDIGEIGLEEALELFSIALEEKKVPAIPSQAIIFANLGSVRTLPRDAVLFLGMQEGVLFDRQQVIEAIITAKKHLYISYQSYSFTSRTFLEPAGIVHDLLQIVDGEIVDHSLASASEELYKLDTPLEPNLFVAVHQEVPDVIYTRELSQVAKYPLRTYLQQALGLYLHEYKGAVRASEFEVLDPKIGVPLKKEAFTLSKEEGQALASKEYRFLPETLRAAACMLFNEDLAALQDQAKALGLQGDKPITVELSLTCNQAEEKAPNHWRVPAISVEYEGKKVQLAGRVSNLYLEGLLLFEKKSPEALLKAWPDLLILQLLKEKIAVKPNVLYVKDAKVERIELENPAKMLQEYVAYALECRKRPYCIYPDLVSKLVASDTPQTLVEVRCPYLEFYLSRVAPDDLAAHWLESKKRLEPLFGGLHGL